MSAPAPRGTKVHCCTYLPPLQVHNEFHHPVTRARGLTVDTVALTLGWPHRSMQLMLLSTLAQGGLDGMTFIVNALYVLAIVMATSHNYPMF